jgi:hypothetical protein
MNAAPDVSESSPAMQCNSVDFPEPDGPIMALNRAVSNATVTPSSARTSVEPLPYSFTASTIAAAASFGRVAAGEESVIAMPPSDRYDRPAIGAGPRRGVVLLRTRLPSRA